VPFDIRQLRYAIAAANHGSFYRAARALDINGLGPFSVLSGYVDFRRIIDHWRRQGVDEACIRKLAVDTYARVLKASLAALPGMNGLSRRNLSLSLRDGKKAIRQSVQHRGTRAGTKNAS
jgi:hypothetical protein